MRPWSFRLWPAGAADLLHLTDVLLLGLAGHVKDLMRVLMRISSEIPSLRGAVTDLAVQVDLRVSASVGCRSSELAVSIAALGVVL